LNDDWFDTRTNMAYRTKTNARWCVTWVPATTCPIRIYSNTVRFSNGGVAPNGANRPPVRLQDLNFTSWVVTSAGSPRLDCPLAGGQLQCGNFDNTFDSFIQRENTSSWNLQEPTRTSRRHFFSGLIYPVGHPYRHRSTSVNLRITGITLPKLPAVAVVNPFTAPG
jgi:hypothetical protein